MAKETETHTKSNKKMQEEKIFWSELIFAGPLWICQDITTGTTKFCRNNGDGSFPRLASTLRIYHNDSLTFLNMIPCYFGTTVHQASPGPSGFPCEAIYEDEILDPMMQRCSYESASSYEVDRS